MALKTPLKLKTKPRRVYAPLPKAQPLSSATPGAPTGKVERWLVTHGDTGGVLGVVWDLYWFGGRERAEWFFKVPRDLLLLALQPLLPDECLLGERFSGALLAEYLGMEMHTENLRSVTIAPCGTVFSFNKKPTRYFTCALVMGHAGAHDGGAPRQCPATHGLNNGTVVFCTLAAGHKGEHQGFRKRWKTNGKAG